MQDTLLAVTLVVTSFAIALATLLVFSYLDRKRTRRFEGWASSRPSSVAFLFEDERLVDATPEARQLLAAGSADAPDWTRLAGLLRPRFPGLEARLRDLADLGELSVDSEDGTSRIEAVWQKGFSRLTLVDDDGPAGFLGQDRSSLVAMQAELDILRTTAEHVPYLTWRETSNGEVVWANRAYLELAETLSGDTIAQPWPPLRLFDIDTQANGAGSGHSQRFALTVEADKPRRWFNIFQTHLGDEWLMTAAPADDVIQAENAKKDFMATMTNTFAHLPIGLAIFDRTRQLALFNPALTDLTLLPADFLCARPSLFSFLDRLRDKRMMPEPKDYKTWRQQMADLEAKAVDGTYEETWALPTGQTYRVTGRPHPDGAVAFLFEDISSEISLTRRFRAELELGQAVLDSLPEAIAVFTSNGTLAISNQSYSGLWGDDPSTGLDVLNITDATRHWHGKCSPTPVWQKLEEFVRGGKNRRDWSAPVSLKDGRILDCRVVPIGLGGTLVAFGSDRKIAEQTSSPPKVQEAAGV